MGCHALDVGFADPDDASAARLLSGFGTGDERGFPEWWPRRADRVAGTSATCLLSGHAEFVNITSVKVLF
jgi:hypothetical protein